MGETKNILPIHFPGSAFYKQTIDGHNFDDIERGLENEGGTGIEPLVIFANTVKGKGVSFMEGNNLYHYKNLSDGEYEAAKQELNAG
jgi:transketolase